MVTNDFNSASIDVWINETFSFSSFLQFVLVNKPYLMQYDR